MIGFTGAPAGGGRATGFTGALACVRCGTEIRTTTPWTGCPTCLEGGIHANVLPVYSSAGPDAAAPNENQPGLFRYRHRLPVPDDAEPVSLAEGRTPLVQAHRLAGEVGVDQLWFKDEARNPTWSYKDRLAAVAVTVARARGADTVALSTTGNHGAAAAAYAAAAGLRCVALTLTSVPSTMKVLMQSYGAEVVALRTGPERWALLRQGVEQRNWVPLSGFMNPPVGSNPYGVDGYKTIAFEIAADLGKVPDVVVVPAAYGDGLVGIQRGFADLVALGAADRQPRLVVVDPFGAYAAALAADAELGAPAGAGLGVLPAVDVGETSSFSIATPYATHQGLAAVRASDGLAVGVPDDATVMAAQRRIASSIGLFLEASSAICLPAVETLRRQGHLAAGGTVVCLATSTGLKDVGAAERRLPEVPVVEPDLVELERVLDGARASER